MGDGDSLALVDLLMSHQVPLVIIGGHAVNLHGHLRATEDIDVVYRRTRQSVESLLEALCAAEAFQIDSEIDPDTGIEKTIPITRQAIETNHLLMLGSKHGYIDLFDFIPGLPDQPLDDLFATAVVADGRPFASLDWLKRMKRAAGRPQDIEDLKNLP